jgi:lincosamide nucleotidyltransferase A/C/D/E
VTRMTAEDIVELYSGLLARGVQLWVDGGWGIDALAGRQTRPHKDCDAIAAFEDLPALARFLSERGFSLKLIWEENRWAPCPEPPPLVGRSRPVAQAATAFVLEDGSGREMDFHVVRLDEHGRWTPAWDTDLVFPAEAFTGVGTVGGTTVRCLSAQMQMRTHTGYALKESDLHDLHLLHERFGSTTPTRSLTSSRPGRHRRFVRTPTLSEKGSESTIRRPPTG